MRYIIKREWPTGETKFVYRDWPRIEWTDNEMVALRMHPERAAKASYSLMLTGMSHTIEQFSEF